MFHKNFNSTMEFTKDETCSTDYSDDKDLNLNILEEHFEEINVDPVCFESLMLNFFLPLNLVSYLI